MVTLAEIETELADTDADVGISSANTFREITGVLDISPELAGWLETALHTILELLPIVQAFDQDNKPVWENWESTILKVQAILQSPPQNSFSKPKLKTTSYLSSWITPIHPLAPSGILPAKAVWLIGRRMHYIQGKTGNGVRSRLFTQFQEEYLANTLRKCSTLKWAQLGFAKFYIPSWPSSSPLAWTNSVKEKAQLLSSHYSSYTSDFDFIRTLYKILKHLSPSSVPLPTFPTKIELLTKMAVILRNISLSQQLFNGSNIEQHPSRDPTEDDTDIFILSRPSHTVARHRPSSRPSFQYFQEPVSSDEVDTLALDPDSLYVEPQGDTPADEPLPLPALESLDVRYSNYRTSMDNQRLPWTWGRLNHFEIAALREAILQTTNQYSTATPPSQGAFITWLMLSTGQGIEQILKISLSETRSAYGCLMSGPTYRRLIPTPPKAYKPSADEKTLLNAHSQYIDVLLAPPFPPHIFELGLTNGKVVPIEKFPTIGAYLKVDASDAEKCVREFLEGNRTRKLRLLPGKIRLALATEIMRMSNDHVATHLISALPTDMPPSGVYYTTYSTLALRDIYQIALANIFGEHS